MKKTFILLTLCIMAGINTFGQKKEYQLPPYDFVTFTRNPNTFPFSESDTSVYLLEINKYDLEKSIRMGQFFGRTPPTRITFYNKGICTEINYGYIELSEERLKQAKKLEKKTETFLSSDEYEYRRKELSGKENVYIIEKECKGNHFSSGEETGSNGKNSIYVLIRYEY
jgi:hypothetical protein